MVGTSSFSPEPINAQIPRSLLAQSGKPAPGAAGIVQSGMPVDRGRARPIADDIQELVTDLETIGIMADSHGNADMIAAALRFFKARGCGRLVHLGDICDSVAFQQADECVALLHSHHVLAVKGNNDHALANHGQATQSTVISAETIAYLEAVPLQIELAAALFVHSRPSLDILGMAAMIGDIDQVEVARLRKQYPEKILFRGHGHSPQVAMLNGSQARPVSPDSGNRWRIDNRQGWIVTCGALFKGLCMTWTPATGSLISHRLTA